MSKDNLFCYNHIKEMLKRWKNGEKDKLDALYLSSWYLKNDLESFIKKSGEKNKDQDYSKIAKELLEK